MLAGVDSLLQQQGLSAQVCFEACLCCMSLPQLGSLSWSLSKLRHSRLQAPRRRLHVREALGPEADFSGVSASFAQCRGAQPRDTLVADDADSMQTRPSASADDRMMRQASVPNQDVRHSLATAHGRAQRRCGQQRSEPTPAAAGAAVQHSLQVKTTPTRVCVVQVAVSRFVGPSTGLQACAVARATAVATMQEGHVQSISPDASPSPSRAATRTRDISSAGGAAAATTISKRRLALSSKQVRQAPHAWHHICYMSPEINWKRKNYSFVSAHVYGYVFCRMYLRQATTQRAIEQQSGGTDGQYGKHGSTDACLGRSYRSWRWQVDVLYPAVAFVSVAMSEVCSNATPEQPVLGTICQAIDAMFGQIQGRNLERGAVTCTGAARRPGPGRTGTRGRSRR